jgi:hypothetical protein
MSLFSAKNSIRWTPSEMILPMQCVRRGSRIGGVMVSLFALGWCGCLLACIVAGTLQEGVNVGMTLLLLAFTLPGLLFLWIGLNMLFGRREIFIDREQVTVGDKGLGRTRSWSEPLSAYAGVLRRVVHHSGTRHSTSWTEWLVVLAHENPDREIQLFEARSGAGVMELQTETWRRLAALLERPLLEENAEGVFAIDAERFDAPLREKRPAATAEPQAPSDPGGGVAVTCEGNATVFACRRFRNSWKGALGLVVTLALLAVARHIEATDADAEGIRVFIWLMYGFAALFALAFLTELAGREELRVDHARVIHRRRHGLATRERSLEVGEIRAVSVKRDERVSSASCAVVIEGRNATIRFGESLPRETLIGVKDRVLAKLGEEAPSALRDAAPAVKVGDPIRAARSRLAWVPVVVLAFFGLLGVLMHFAFDSQTGGNGATRVEPAREAPARPRALAAERDAVFQSWHRHYAAAEEAVRRQDYALAEREFRAALSHAEQLGPSEPMLASTFEYLGWVLERRERTAEGRELRRRADVLRAATNR